MTQGTYSKNASALHDIAQKAEEGPQAFLISQRMKINRSKKLAVL
jgi:hypothetical protein